MTGAELALFTQVEQSEFISGSKGGAEIFGIHGNHSTVKTRVLRFGAGPVHDSVQSIKRDR